MWVLLPTGHLALDTGHWILDTGHLALDTLHSTLDTKHLALDTWHWTLGAEHLALSTLHWTLGTKHLALCEALPPTSREETRLGVTKRARIASFPPWGSNQNAISSVR